MYAQIQQADCISKAPSTAVISLYNYLGQSVIQTSNKTIDLSHLSNGVYEVVIQHNSRIIKERMISYEAYKRDYKKRIAKKKFRQGYDMYDEKSDIGLP